MNARVITVASRKGGAGKSTLAIHLFAFLRELGVPVRLVDCDPQQSCMAWDARGRLVQSDPHDRRARNRLQITKDIAPFRIPRLPNATSDAPDIVSALSRRSLLEVDRDDRIMIYDTAGDLSGVTAAAIELAELVVVPVRPSELDVDSSRATVERASANHRQAVVVLSACPSQRMAAAGRARLEALGLPVVEPAIRQRIAYADSIALGRTVWSPGFRQRRGAARQELASVFRWILEPTLS